MPTDKKFTPGPWEPSEHTYEVGNDIQSTVYSLSEAILVTVATVHGDNKEIVRANAELIASAPTLKAENEKLKEAAKKYGYEIVLKENEQLRADLSEMKKEREELFQEVHRIISNAACKLDALDMLESLLSRIKK